MITLNTEPAASTSRRSGRRFVRRTDIGWVTHTVFRRHLAESGTSSSHEQCEQDSKSWILATYEKNQSGAEWEKDF